MTPAELSEKRTKGLCFQCDEKFELGHICKNKAELYLLELVEEELIPEELEEEVFNVEEIT